MSEIQQQPMERKKRVLSCIQPTGVPTLGNYFGALRNWVQMQEEFDCFYAVADLHAITVRQEPSKFRQQIMETFALLLEQKPAVRAVAGSGTRAIILAVVLLHAVRRIVAHDAVQGQICQARG